MPTGRATRPLRFPVPPAAPAVRRLVDNPVFLAAAVFFATKLPLLVYPRHWEELRDLDAYLKVAAGFLPYRDFEWQYGPLAPLLYGLALKALPELLLSVRVLSLVVWTVGAVYAARLLSRLSTSRAFIVGGTWIALSATAFPNYSHNHPLALVATLAAVHHWLKYLDSGEDRDLLFSLGGVLACLGTRPLLAGYGLAAAAAIVLALHFRRHAPRAATVSKLAGVLVATSALALLVYGPAVRYGFLPRPSAVHAPGAYPNLHALVPILPDFRTDPLVSLAKGLRAALDTAFFYLHYFILPTILVVRWRNRSPVTVDRSLAVAFACAAGGWAISLDGLHHGDASPELNPVLLGRGMYFIPLTALAAVILTREAWQRRGRRVFAAVGVAGLAGFVLFGNFGHLSLLREARRDGLAWSRFPVLAGTLSLGQLAPLESALAAVNERCTKEDVAFIGVYTAAAHRLLRCRELLSDDPMLLDSRAHATIPRGRSPYNPAKAMTVDEIVRARFAATRPRFLVLTDDSPFLDLCDGPGWEIRRFGSPRNVTSCRGTEKASGGGN